MALTVKENITVFPATGKHGIDLPGTPVLISNEPKDLSNADIELHSTSGVIHYGKLSALDYTSQIMRYYSTGEFKEKTIPLADIRLLIFSRELKYSPKENAIKHQLQNSVLPDMPRTFSVKFTDSQVLSGDSAISIKDDIAVHIFRVKGNSSSSRMFIPLANIEQFELGDQIGTILKSNHAITDQDLQQGLQEQNKIRKRPLGDYLREKGLVSEEALQKALYEQGKWPKILLGQLLLNAGCITQEQLDNALNVQKDDRGRRLGDILISIGATTEQAVHTALAQKLGVPFVQLKEFEIDPVVTSLVPVNVARRHTAMPLVLSDTHLVIAVPDPTRLEDTKLISFASNRRVEVVVATPSDINWAINTYYGMDDDVDDLIETEISPANDATGYDEEMEKLANERPIVRLVLKLLLDSIRRNASDIHIRPTSKGAQVLFRIHGKLTNLRTLSKSMLAPIVARIKVIARMDVAQHRLPQDGRVQIKVEGMVKDMRISVIPTVEGESIVIRLLASVSSLKPVDQLGFRTEDVNTLNELLHRGAGLILVTGPTGSGKSTTLYSALNVLRSMDLNIITVEDPVEIRLDGLEQIQVQHEIGRDFGLILRNILRHDPDVIMIGEIRDEETANIAVQATQTGHLVLSTLHTNSAADTIVRLGEMKVEPYRIASALLGIVAQRLIKKNCEHCKQPETTAANIRQLLGVSVEETFYKGAGCDQCENTGVSGRVPAYEFLHVSQSLQSAILYGASTQELNRLASSWGMQPIYDCALRYARLGETSLAEVHRVYVT